MSAGSAAMETAEGSRAAAALGARLLAALDVRPKVAAHPGVSDAQSRIHVRGAARGAATATGETAATAMVAWTQSGTMFVAVALWLLWLGLAWLLWLWLWLLGLWL